MATIWTPQENLILTNVRQALPDAFIPKETPHPTQLYESLWELIKNEEFELIYGSTVLTNGGAMLAEYGSEEAMKAMPRERKGYFVEKNTEIAAKVGAHIFTTKALSNDYKLIVPGQLGVVVDKGGRVVTEGFFAELWADVISGLPPKYLHDNESYLNEIRKACNQGMDNYEGEKDPEGKRKRAFFYDTLLVGYIDLVRRFDDNPENEKQYGKRKPVAAYLGHFDVMSHEGDVLRRSYGSCFELMLAEALGIPTYFLSIDVEHSTFDKELREMLILFKQVGVYMLTHKSDKKHPFRFIPHNLKRSLLAHTLSAPYSKDSYSMTGSSRREVFPD